ncbi:MAG: hypothetical protein AAF495_09115 [Pseudomonadota bacterium]
MTEPDKSREAGRRLRVKNWLLAGALVAFVVIIYLVSVVRMGEL